MMNYHLQPRKKSYFKSPKIVWSVGVLVLVGGIHLLFPAFFSGVFHKIITPFWSAGESVTEKTKDYGNLTQSRKSLIQENEELKQSLSEVRFLSEENSFLREENISLKNLLDYRPENKQIVGVILARPPVSLYDTFVISVGTAHGVSEGDVVLTTPSVPVGEVVRALSRTSLVKLYSSPGEETQVLIGASRTLATAKGQGGGMLLIDLPRDVSVIEGDIIVLPLASPRLFGVVEQIEASPADPFQKLYFQSPASLFSGEYVSVVSRGAEFKETLELLEEVESPAEDEDEEEEEL